jgi:hypothetical protein
MYPSTRGKLVTDALDAKRVRIGEGDGDADDVSLGRGASPTGSGQETGPGIEVRGQFGGSGRH